MKWLRCISSQEAILTHQCSLHLSCRPKGIHGLKAAKSIQHWSLNTADSLDVTRRESADEVNDSSGPIVNAHKPFDEISERDAPSWTSMISMNAKAGLPLRALDCFSQMREVGVEPNEMTFSALVSICCKLRNIRYGMSLHCLILKKGFSRHPFISSGFISMYSKCDLVDECESVFYEASKKDVVTFNTMITGYVQNNLNEEAISLFSTILWRDAKGVLAVNNFILASVIKACAASESVRTGKCVHSYAIKLNYSSDIVVAASMIDMYSRFGCLDKGLLIFDQMGSRDVVAWNSMITGLAQNFYNKEAIELYYQLQSEDFFPNETTFTSVLKALAEAADSVLGGSFHAKVIKMGYFWDLFVGTALIDMYSKCLIIEDAEKVFTEMKRKNLVSFNALIAGYSSVGRYKDATKSYICLLRENMDPDTITLSGLLSSCSQMEALSEGTEVHAHAIKFGLDSKVSVGNSLVGLYSKCGLTDCALKAFESVSTHNALSWAGIVSGFVHNGEGEYAVKYFYKMLALSEKPDEFVLSSILKVIAGWAVRENGKQVHAYVIKFGLDSHIYVGSALVDMYSKCGMIEDSYRIFASMPEKNIVSWNSMIMGFAQNGLWHKALCAFEEMKESKVDPTSVTFIGILLACSHSGLVSEGRRFFEMMISDYRISPSLEHCTCLVGLLGRSGHLDEAEAFILNSQFSSEPSIWKSLLAACWLHHDSVVGIRVAERCLVMKPRDSSTCVLLSNIYASKCSWEEVERARNLTRNVGLEKEPGCSWIDIRNSIHVFISDDRSCSANDGLVEALQSLMKLAKMDYFIENIQET